MHQNKKLGGGGNPADVTPGCVVALVLTDYRSSGGRGERLTAGRMRHKIREVGWGWSRKEEKEKMKAESGG